MSTVIAVTTSHQGILPSNIFYYNKFHQINLKKTFFIFPFYFHVPFPLGFSLVYRCLRNIFKGNFTGWSKFNRFPNDHGMVIAGGGRVESTNPANDWDGKKEVSADFWKMITVGFQGRVRGRLNICKLFNYDITWIECQCCGLGRGIEKVILSSPILLIQFDGLWIVQNSQEDNWM